ncbi:MAG: hypothetical protein DRP09_19385 [Candidatus Thorarchaeota archaeon]|nr:MAG: hypothetical protein DRP09_19385 [Candidatus Thorarchaeota archaeon]
MEQKEEKRGKRRRRLTAEKKFEIFLETMQSGTSVGEVLRREGIYASDLARYRRMIREGAVERLKRAEKRGPTEEERRIARLEKEIRQRDELIARISMERMILLKKANGE